ncbi:hypothetical protein EV643_1319 [Kribbella sp. VKM Ac-2527]|uniref:YD repeat-containing protein n=1 Tax=Kribbella caucasensis TaxID=2512215 RepID=A0A4R6JD25_9ACTN|nr:hypothetical protein [Kribbella sp. VKM Ac-2527]TDO33743.1 hypothetical protein EV643_1319 [Kribbella sp. VKM Ac-2527]
MQESTPRQRVIRLLATGLAAAAVAGVTIITAAVTGNNDQAAAGSSEPAVAGSSGPAGSPNSTPTPPAIPAPAKEKQAGAITRKAPKATKYVFQNERPEVGTLPAGGEVKIAEHLYFATRGTQWAVISRVPGEPEYEPFGWRRTVGNDNIGDGTSPGLQSVGPVTSSVFKNAKVSTVVYTRGNQAWYGKVYRLAGIPGWVESSADLTASDPEPKSTPGPQGPDTSVFAYDAAGKLLAQFPDSKSNPLAK